MIEKLKEKVIMLKNRASIVASVVVGTVFAPVVALAEGETATTDMTAINSAMATAFASIRSEALSTIASIIPYALSIASVMILVNLAMRAFTRVSGAHK